MPALWCEFCEEARSVSEALACRKRDCPLGAAPVRPITPSSIPARVERWERGFGGGEGPFG